jgi:hypothetical protein
MVSRGPRTAVCVAALVVAAVVFSTARNQPHHQTPAWRSSAARGVQWTCPSIDSPAATGQTPTIDHCRKRCDSQSLILAVLVRNATKPLCSALTYNAVSSDCRLFSCPALRGEGVMGQLEPSTSEHDVSEWSTASRRESQVDLSALWDVALPAPGRGIGILILAQASPGGQLRLREQLQTWLASPLLSSVVVLLDAIGCTSGRAADVKLLVAGARPRVPATLAIEVAPAEDGPLTNPSAPSKCTPGSKALPGVLAALRHCPACSHHVFVDDDTYLMPGNLVKLLRLYDLQRTSNASAALAIGSMWFGEAAAGSTFLHGGAGIVLPRVAAELTGSAIVRGLCSETPACRISVAGDFRLSCCLLAAGVAFSHEAGFQHSSPETAKRLGSDRKVSFPVSFHAMQPGEMQQLHDRVVAAEARRRGGSAEPVWWSDVLP